MPDFKPNSLKLSSHLVIPEAQRLDSLRGEKLLSPFIVLLLSGIPMSTSIEFDRQLRFDAEEIEEVDPAGILAREFKVVETAVSQKAPETLLCVSGFLAEPAGEFAGGCGSSAPGTPHPSPLPSEGRGDSRSGLFGRRFHFTEFSFGVDGVPASGVCTFTFT
jgi:hypothetical protein